MKKNTFLKSCGIILIYLCLNVLGALLFNEIKKPTAFMTNIFYIVESTVILGIVTFIVKDKLKGQAKGFKDNFKKYFPTILRYWLVGFALMMITNLLINVFVLNGIAPNEAANRTILTRYPVYSILSMCVIGPITEELLFRLNFKGSIKKRVPFILITGIIFGSLHVLLSLSSLTDFLYIIPYSCLGIAFGTIYYDTKNIYSSILAHTFHNTLSIIVILLGI